VSLGRGEHLIDAGVGKEFGQVRGHHRVHPLGGGLLRVVLIRSGHQ
jgi:hypothetical protein